MLYIDAKESFKTTEQIGLYPEQEITYEQIRDTIQGIASFLESINKPHWLAQILNDYYSNTDLPEDSIKEFLDKKLSQYPQPDTLPIKIWYDNGKLIKTLPSQVLAPPARLATKQEYQSLLDKSKLSLKVSEYVQINEGIFQLGSNLHLLKQHYYPNPLD